MAVKSEIEKMIEKGSLYAVLKGRIGEKIKLVKDLKESEIDKTIFFIEDKYEMQAYKNSPRGEKEDKRSFWRGRLPLEETKKEVVRILRSYRE